MTALIFAWSVSAEAQLSKEQVKQLEKQFHEKTKAGKANYIFESIYKGMNLNYPDCTEKLFAEKIKTCEKFNCIGQDSFSGFSFIKEAVVIPSKDKPGACIVKTHQKSYTVMRPQLENFGKVFNDIFTEKSEDDFRLVVGVGKEGSAKKEVSFSNAGKICKFDIYYSFALNKNGLIKSDVQQKKNGLLVKDKTTYYTEAGVTYERAPGKKDVFFYPKVKFIDNLQKNEKNCQNIINLIPYILDLLDQVEHLPPEAIL